MARISSPTRNERWNAITRSNLPRFLPPLTDWSQQLKTRTFMNKIPSLMNGCLWTPLAMDYLEVFKQILDRFYTLYNDIYLSFTKTKFLGPPPDVYNGAHLCRMCFSFSLSFLT